MLHGTRISSLSHWHPISRDRTNRTIGCLTTKILRFYSSAPAITQKGRGGVVPVPGRATGLASARNPLSIGMSSAPGGICWLPHGETREVGRGPRVIGGVNGGSTNSSSSRRIAVHSRWSSDALPLLFLKARALGRNRQALRQHPHDLPRCPDALFVLICKIPRVCPVDMSSSKKTTSHRSMVPRALVTRLRHRSSNTNAGPGNHALYLYEKKTIRNVISTNIHTKLTLHS